MKERGRISLSISDRSFNIDLGLNDDELIGAFLTMLAIYVKKRGPIKVTYSYGSSLSSSTQIITKLLSNPEQVERFKEEMKQLLQVVRKSA